MHCLVFTAALLTACSAAKATNTTLLQHQYRDNEGYLNQSAIKWYNSLQEAPSQTPGYAQALSRLSLSDFQAAVLAMARRPITIDSPKCANDSHLPIRKCLGRGNKQATQAVKQIINAQERACKAGISSLVDWSFESRVSQCFKPVNRSCAAQAPTCVQNLVHNLDGKLLDMLTGQQLQKRDAIEPLSNQTSSNSTALQLAHRKLAVDLVVVTSIGDTFAILFFFANPITETLLPLIFLTTALGIAAESLRRLNQ